MAIKLNGWQRIGIIISLLWFISAYEYQTSEISDKAVKTAGTMMRMCLDSTNNYKVEDCFKEYNKYYLMESKYMYGNGLFMGIAPIPLAWLFVYLAIKVFAWVRQGFKIKDE